MSCCREVPVLNFQTFEVARATNYITQLMTILHFHNFGERITKISAIHCKVRFLFQVPCVLRLCKRSRRRVAIELYGPFCSARYAA